MSTSSPEGRRALAALVAHRDAAEAVRAGRATAATLTDAKEEMLSALAAYVGQRAELIGARMRETARCRSAR